MTGFFLIAAVDMSDGIGKDGKIPWHLPEDLKLFKQLTSAHDKSLGKQPAIIMGRKTFESLPRLLPGRKHIVLSRSGFSAPGAHVVESLDDALDAAEECLFASVIGGEEIYRLAIAHPQCTRVYLTRVHGTWPCDAFFCTRDLELRFEHDKVLKSYVPTAESPGDHVAFTSSVWLPKSISCAITELHAAP